MGSASGCRGLQYLADISNFTGCAERRPSGINADQIARRSVSLRGDLLFAPLTCGMAGNEWQIRSPEPFGDLFDFKPEY